MRIPVGAPSTNWFRLKQQYPSLRRIRKPTNGTLAVIGCVGLTLTAIGLMFVQPMLYNDYYKDVQQRNRALLGADRESLAQGLRVWSDPFKDPK